MLVLACYDILYIFVNIIIFGLPNIFSRLIFSMTRNDILSQVFSMEGDSLYMSSVPILLPIAQIGLTGEHIVCGSGIDEYH